MPILARAAALALCLLVPEALAQTATLNGFVRDADSGETLIQATVLLDGPVERGAATNTQGFYTVGSLPAGAYAVTVSYVGYQTLRE
ncbi:MAG: carboxypeptidase regulatory-like domain-containing protein [Bacteroidota bacterium]